MLEAASDHRVAHHVEAMERASVGMEINRYACVHQPASIIQILVEEEIERPDPDPRRWQV